MAPLALPSNHTSPSGPPLVLLPPASLVRLKLSRTCLVFIMIIFLYARQRLALLDPAVGDQLGGSVDFFRLSEVVRCRVGLVRIRPAFYHGHNITVVFVAAVDYGRRLLLWGHRRRLLLLLAVIAALSDSAGAGDGLRLAHLGLVIVTDVLFG